MIATSAPRVWVFFYGTFLNEEVCANVGVRLEAAEPAQLAGFDIEIAPLANLVRSDQHTVFGVIARVSHDDLARLYAQDWVGTYLPEAVVVVTRGDRLLPVLTYIKPEMSRAQAADDYIDRIVEPGRRFGFPSWYLQRLESFRRAPPQP